VASDDDVHKEIQRTINRSLAAKKRKAKWDWDKNFVFPSRLWLSEKTMRKIVELGWSSTRIYFDEWSPHLFLTTSLRSAYEVANEFALDDHKNGQRLSILAIRRDMVQDTHPDRHLHLGKTVPKRKDGEMLSVPRRWSVMTDQPIPASAIVSRYDLPKRRPRVLPRWLRPL